MTSPAGKLDASQDVLLALLLEVRQRVDTSGARRFLQIIDVANLQLLVQGTDLLRSDAFDRRELDHVYRRALAELLQLAAMSGLQQLPDPLGNPLADARGLLQRFSAACFPDAATGRSSASIAHAAFSNARGLKSTPSISK